MSSLPNLGGHKPSKIMVDMVEFCLAGLELSPLHSHSLTCSLFTKRLLQALRTQLGEVEPGNLRALAARADKLWAVHTPSSSTIASVSAMEMVEASSGACATIRDGRKGLKGQ